MRKLLTYSCLTLLLSSSLSADFGDNPIEWSSTESADFQDFAIRTFNRQGAIVNQYWPHYWLNQTLLTLNLASPKKIDNTIPLILKQSSINAFAIPGNVIGIHTGLWRFTDNESELVSVLAHETAHIALDHFSRLTKNSNQQAINVASGILLTILLAQNNAEMANAALLTTLASAQQNRLNFSRTMEVEADQLAQSVMESTSYDVEAGRVFFQKLDANSGIASAYEFLLTHPLGTTRSSNLSSRQQVSQQPRDERLFRFLTTYLLYDRIDTDIQFDSASTEPNTAFAIALQTHAQTDDSATFIADLTNIINLYPSFRPAQYEKLRLQVEQQDKRLCASFQTLQNEAQSVYLTLNVVEDFKRGAELCSHSSANYWHAKLLWLSGREAQALNFLGKALNVETNTNQAARLKQQLNQYNLRYERFR